MSDITGLGDCGSNGRWPSGFEVQTLTTVSAPYPGFGLAGGNRRRRADPVQDLRTLHALLRFTGGPAPAIAGGGGSTFIFGALPPPVGVQKESPCCPRSCLAGKKRCPGISQDSLPGEPPAGAPAGTGGEPESGCGEEGDGVFPGSPVPCSELQHWRRRPRRARRCQGRRGYVEPGTNTGQGTGGSGSAGTPLPALLQRK